MKWMKRATALLLCFLMLTNGPISAFATERTDNIVVETTATTETEEVCEECGGSDAHTETCSYNTVTSLTMEAPAVTTEPTTTPTAATGSAISTDPVGCAECGQTEGHSTECSQYEAPVEDIVKSTGPQVGDKIWIRKGAKVYRNLNSDKSWTLLGNYEVKIVEIETDEDGNPQWYRFEFTTLGLGEVLLHGYKYVAAADTSEEEPEPSEPVDENACNCGENAPENIADHADSCPRKQYIKTLFEGKTAEEIYAQWETYDEATQTDLLNMLQKWDNEKYEELKNLVSGASTEQTVDDMTFTSTVPVTVKSTADTKRTAITGAAPFMDSEKEYHFFDIDANSAEETEITVSGLVTDNQNKSVVVLHLLDSADAILAAQKNGMGIDYFTVSDASEFAEEVNAANDALGVSNRVYYTFAEAKMDANGDISFKTDSFSTFVFVVTFGYDGYNYDLMGKGSIYLSDLMRGLGMSQNVSTVTDVSFSDPSLLTIEKNQNDWVLTSLNAFSSTEWLEITFSNGQTVKIKVTDPILKYYLEGNNNWNMGTTSSTIKPSGADSLGNKTTNTTVITAEEVAAAANSDPLDVDLVIYARPGMAIGFQSGTTWEYGSWNADIYRNNGYNRNNWEWIWNGSVNYALLPSVTDVTTAEFKLTVSDKTCTVRIYIIPETVTLPVTDQPSKVKDTLGADSRYAVKSLPVTLYNYDGKAFNEYYKNQRYWLAFHGVSKGVSANNDLTLPWEDPYLPNSGSNSTGIMKDRLENNLPVMASAANTDLFSTSAIPGKTVYQNVGFEYIYDNDTGYYTYSSNLNHAQFNGSNLIELYNQTLAPVIGNSQNSKAGFYPFVDINKAIKNYSGESHRNWRDNLETDYFQQNAQYVQDLVSTGTVSTEAHPSAVSTVDMHFGLQLEADFYMPIGRQVDANGDGNKEDLIYTFTGDDDLWVYVDDQLVLDLGGAHTAISGTINFTDQTVTLGEYHKVTATGNEYTLGDQDYSKIFTFGDLGIDVSEDQMHTMRVFYLERWSGESNCRMRFNLPLIPSNAVNVSKNLTNQDGEKLSVTPDVNYTFTLYTAADDDDDIDAMNFAPAAGATYTVIGAGAPKDTQYTNDKGQFTLKDGWVASFSDIKRFTEVYVVESKPNDDYKYVGSTISVDNASATKYIFDQNSETKVMPSDKGISFSFTNKMQTQPLKIEKQVVNGTQGLIDPGQKFTFTLDFTKLIVEKGEGAISATNQVGADVRLTDGKDFQLGHGESITIPRVPVNMTFTLKEANPDKTNGSFDAPKFAYTNCTTTQTPNAFDTDYTWIMVDNGENKIVVTNQQRFNLTINKTGIQNVDHDNDEQQSTIYTIVGKVDNKELVKMNVAICGNDSVTVCKLPVGLYTVEENTDWAWRYDPQGEATRTVDIPQSANADVTYNNNRTNQNWLSGDSYCENWWGSDGNVVRKKVNN